MPGYLFAPRCMVSTFTPSIHISRKPTFGSEDHFACMTKSCQWFRRSGANFSDSRHALVVKSTRHIVMSVLFAPRYSGAPPVSTCPFASWCHSRIDPADDRDDGVMSSSHLG